MFTKPFDFYNQLSENVVIVRKKKFFLLNSRQLWNSDCCMVSYF
jgi:hypothetical protein